MRLALLSYRFPWPPYTGDRVRAIRWLEAMLPLGNVTLIAPAGVIPSGFAAVEHVPLRFSARRLAAASASVLRSGLPFHTTTAGAFDWSEAIHRAEAGGAFDAAVTLLWRCAPWTGRLRAQFRVMDAIDASSSSMEMRARASQRGRFFWRNEGLRAAALEAAFPRKYDCLVVVNEQERQRFDGNALAVGSGVHIYPPGKGRRDFDFGFWGRIEYFANHDAVSRLIKTIWPEVRRALPAATLLIGGADVPRSVAKWNGRAGITVISPIDDRASLLRRVAVAVFPLRYGTGVSNKMLEAAEASCAIVATPSALAGLDRLRGEVAIGESDSELAARCVALARDRERVRQAGDSLRRIAEEHYSAAVAAEELRDILRRRIAS